MLTKKKKKIKENVSKFKQIPGEKLACLAKMKIDSPM